ncbi:MAG TPA: DegV family protein [Syntrophomonadaceae bacterium]|nr:DegV family protein [Syntrophomonadaceae bacterium]
MREKIALLTDSACDLPKYLIDKYKIKVLPLKVIYPNHEYSDRIDIQPDEVYNRMPEEIPTTSMPSPHEIKKAINNLKQEGFTHLLAMHLSSELSGTFQAVKSVTQEIDNMVVKVFDTKTLSAGTGWMVLDAARNIAKGFSYDKVVERIANLQPKVKVYYIIETLEYLRRGGRIGNVAAMLGQFLHLKPIISVDEEGKYFTYAKTRGRNKSIEKLVQIVEQAVTERTINLAIMHGGAKQEFDKLVDRLKDLPNIKELITSDISPTLGVHTGPGLLGVSYYEV